MKQNFALNFLYIIYLLKLDHIRFCAISSLTQKGSQNLCLKNGYML